MAKIREMPDNEQPVNRLCAYGPGALSTTELLSIILRTESLDDASNLLAAFGSLARLASASIEEIASAPRVGQVVAARLKAALELGARLNAERNDVACIRCPADAAGLLMPAMGTLEQEEMRILLLDTKNRVIAIVTLYRGSTNTTLLRVGELFREAVRRNAVSIIVAHNHPSGDPTPSPEDVAVTRQIVEAGKLMDIQVMDHLVIGLNRWVSLKERGLGF
jgi:DNA repair protein RadC